tara:strand:+ start:1320 stop:1997 length:678 start_codon:yes stop_codon:yes gene_type:complete
MCFNETASLAAFSIGVLSTMILLHMKLYKFSIFYTSIFLMQLIEYYAHKSLLTNDTNMNKISAYFGYFLIITQPIILSYISFNDLHKNSQNTLIILCLAYIIYGLYVFLKTYKSKNFRISYAENICKTTVCRLKWEYYNVNFYNSLILLLLYFSITYFVGFNRKSKNISILPILTFLLGLTMLYVVFETKELNINFSLNSLWSSLWCFMCVIVGPLVIMNKNLAI